MNFKPKVSVLMPVYNAEMYLRKAIESVLNQSFKDFELVVVEDGSTDHSAEIIRSYNDPRIRMVINRKNRGLIDSLNLGIQHCRGSYIARMDSDDICFKERLELQFGYLEKHPEIGVLGSYVIQFGEKGRRLVRYPVEHETIAAAACFDSPLAHPSVFLRASLVRGRKQVFKKEALHGEDYELWSRLLWQGVKFHVLPEPLLWYRLHPGQVSLLHLERQVYTGDQVRKSWLIKLGLIPNKKNIELHRTATRGPWPVSCEVFLEIKEWLLKLREANRQKSLFDPIAFESTLAQRWMTLLRAHSIYGFWTLKQLLKNPFKSTFPYRRIKIAILVARTLQMSLHLKQPSNPVAN